MPSYWVDSSGTLEETTAIATISENLIFEEKFKQLQFIQEYAVPNWSGVVDESYKRELDIYVIKIKNIIKGISNILKFQFFYPLRY